MDPGHIEPALREALNAIASAMQLASQPWWIIGSAAAALHGVSLPVADVDLLLAPNDATRLLLDVGVPPGADGGQGRFRSKVFGRWRAAPIPVDVMAGLHVRHQGRWTEVRPSTRVAMNLALGPVFAPSTAELAAIMRLFGRSKDLVRARRLDELPGS